MPYVSYQGRVFRSRSFGRLAVAAESQKGKTALPPGTSIGQDGRARLSGILIATALRTLKGKPHDICKPTVAAFSTPEYSRNTMLDVCTGAIYRHTRNSPGPLPSGQASKLPSTCLHLGDIDMCRNRSKSTPAFLCNIDVSTSWTAKVWGIFVLCSEPIGQFYAINLESAHAIVSVINSLCFACGLMTSSLELLCSILLTADQTVKADLLEAGKQDSGCDDQLLRFTRLRGYKEIINTTTPDHRGACMRRPVDRRTTGIGLQKP
jgi:hypothetical protein